MSHDALVRGVFPDDVAIAWGEIGDATGELFAEEAALVAHAVPKRQREFARGRVCARRALMALGASPAAVLVGSQREPLWPSGIVGSITHDAVLGVAAVAHGSAYLGLGVDVEPDGPLDPKVAERIWSPEEAEQAAERRELSPGAAARLVFSAKEAFYKCQFPLTRRFVGFHEVRVALGDGTFEVTVLVELGELTAGRRLSGLWRRANGELFTAITLPRGDRA